MVQASKIYALLAAAFSDTLLFGSHRPSGQDQYIEAMGLGPNFASSQDSLGCRANPTSSGDEEADFGRRTLMMNVLPPQLDYGTEDSVAKIIETISGSEPSQVINGDKIIAVAFPAEEEEEASTPWVSRRHDMMTMGLGPAEEPRMNGLSLAPRMCHMAAGGPRRFNVGEQEFARAISPYEVEFTIMHEARGGRHIMPGLFGEQSSLGFACHVTDPSRLAKDHFACVASDMMLVESGTAARVNNATVLMPEEMVFALTTICPSGMELALGFSQGPGGSTDGARAALTGLRLTTRRKDNRQLLLNRNLPGFKVMSKVNAVRSAILENLVSPAEANSSGQEILLWEDEAAQDDFEDLLRMINEAPTIEDLGGAYGANREPVTWVRHRQRLRSEKQEEESGEEDADDEVEDADEDAEDADVRALQPILLFPGLETQVAKKTAESSPVIAHSFECPDCADRFQDWDACREHLVNTGHLDVSTPEAETVAKKQLTKPVRWRCLECFEGFATKADLEKHLRETHHLAFAETDTVRFNLCKPRPIPELDDPSAVISRRLQQSFGQEAEPEAATEEEPVGFFRSLRRTLSAPSSIPARQAQELLPEFVELARDIKLDLPVKLKLQQLDLEEARDLIDNMRRKPVAIDNPNGWLMKAIERRKGQLQELQPEFQALVQDVKDLNLNVKLRLQSLELEEARDLVDQMKRNRVPIKNPSAWLGNAIDKKIRRLQEADKPRAATAKPKAKPKATKQKQPAKTSEEEASEILTPPPLPPLPQLEPKEAEKPAKVKPKTIAKAKKQKQPAKTSEEEASEILTPPPLPPLPQLEPKEAEKPAKVKPKAIAKAKKQKQPAKAEKPAKVKPKAIAKAKKQKQPEKEEEKPTAAAKPKANEKKSANKEKQFVSKLKQADRDEQILAAVLEVAGGTLDPKTSLNLVMQRLLGNNDATVYTCKKSEESFEGKVSLKGEGGTVEFVAKGATKKQAQVNAARAALQGFEQVLERCRPKVDAVAS
ncbi:unnamed protein product [Symbiodinium sp. CCMP2592]|nr:unnamed protein product [Symbiodinium sp. CCMP2592]